MLADVLSPAMTATDIGTHRHRLARSHQRPSVVWRSAPFQRQTFDKRDTRGTSSPGQSPPRFWRKSVLCGRRVLLLADPEIHGTWRARTRSVSRKVLSCERASPARNGGAFSWKCFGEYRGSGPSRCRQLLGHPVDNYSREPQPIVPICCSTPYIRD